MTTLQRALKLLPSISLALADFLKRNQDIIEATYKDDGSPAVAVLNDSQGPLVAYRWAPAASLTTDARQSTSKLRFCERWTRIDWNHTKGAIVYLHGVTETARFGLLRLKGVNDICDISRVATPDDSTMKKVLDFVKQAEIAEEEYEGGWADYFSSKGYVVYAMDMRGHGLSDWWKSSRCNVERLEYAVEDVLQWLSAWKECGEFDSKPIYLMGLSLGGCILARTLEVGFATNRLAVHKLPDENVRPDVPKIAGAVFLAPAVSAERLKRMTPNRYLIPFMHFLSRIVPRLNVAALETNGKYPFLIETIQKDPLVYTDKLPVRLGVESLVEMDNVIPEADKIHPELRVLLIQSELDTMTDPEGSKMFIESLRCKDRTAVYMPYGWHFLTKEPGNYITCEKVFEWMDKY